MKKLSYVFWSALGGVVFCFGMTVVTGVQQHRIRKAQENAPLSIPLPAEDARTAPATH
jgi:hypothetical protein